MIELTRLEKKLIKQTVTDSNVEVLNDKLLIGTMIKEFGSPGIVVNPELARTTGCTCYRTDGKMMCFSKGIIGTLKYPRQVKKFCTVITEKESPALTKRFEKFREAAAEAHKKVEHLPKGARLEKWLESMGEELAERKIEI